MQPTITLNRTLIIRIILGLAGVILLILLAQFIYEYFTTGRVIIQTNQPNAKLTIVNRKTQSAEVIGKGKVDKRLPPGDYTITASADSAESRYTTKLEARQTQKTTLDLTNPQSLSEYANYQAKDIVTEGAKVEFLNIPFQSIYTIPDAQTEGAPYIEDYTITQLDWVQYGLGYFRDTTNNSYKLSPGGVVTSFGIRLKEAPANDPKEAAEEGPGGEADMLSIDDIAVNENGDRVMRHLDKLYYQGSTDEYAEEIQIDGQSINSSFTLSKNGLIVLFSQPEITIGEEGVVDNQPNQKETPREPLKMSIYDVKNRKTVQQITDKDATTEEGSSWSLDGNKLAFITDQTVHILDINTGNITTVLAQTGAENNSIRWVSNTKLSYVEKGAIWIYDSQTQIAIKQATFNYSNVGVYDAYFDKINNSLTVSTYTLGEGLVGKIYQLKL